MTHCFLGAAHTHLGPLQQDYPSLLATLSISSYKSEVSPTLPFGHSRMDIKSDKQQVYSIKLLRPPSSLSWSLKLTAALSPNIPLMPSPSLLPHSLHKAFYSGSSLYVVQLPTASMNQCFQSFILFTDGLGITSLEGISLDFFKRRAQ